MVDNIGYVDYRNRCCPVCSHRFDIYESNNREVHSKIGTSPTLPQKPMPQPQIDSEKEEMRRIIQQIALKVEKTRIREETPKQHLWMSWDKSFVNWDN